jgi:hypothetical protein
MARRYPYIRDEKYVQSTDHELIPARNASLAAMQGSANESIVLQNCLLGCTAV